MAAKWSVPGYAEVRGLGSGATGRVVLARHIGSGRPVAIKYLSRTLVRQQGFLDRFRREAETLARLRDPHIVRLLDYVEVREGAAIVMEPVEGPSLRRLLAANGPCPPEVALTVLHGSLMGLAAAHAHGVVHRDYKPENVLIDGFGDSKLADFGIAVPAGQAASGLGTPAYMAPEQWNGMRATPATDMYAATVVFYECLVGERPFASDTLAGLKVQHESAPVPLERAPEAVRPLLALGMSKNPDRRYQDVPSFVAHLERAAVAGYGTDWKERGTRDLAVAAAVLIAAFPLLAGGVGAGGGGAAAAGSAGVGGAGAGGAGGGVGVPGGGVGAAQAGSSASRMGRILLHLGSATAKVKALVAVLALAAIATTTTVVVANVVPTGGDSKPSSAGSSSPLVVAGPATGTSSDSATGGDSSTPAGSSSTPSDTSSALGPTGSSSAPPSTSSSAPPPGTTTPASTGVPSGTAPSATQPSTTSPPVTATPPPPPSTTTAPALVVTVTAVADYPSLTADCAADPIASFTGTVTANQTVTVAYQWVRSDGTRTAGQQLSLSSGKAVQVKDNTWDTGSGSPQPTGSEKLVVTTRSGLTFSSTAANYTINCVGVSLTTQNQTFKGCTTATPGKVYFTGDVAGLPNSRVTYAYVLDFTAGSPNHQQGVWTTITLDGTGHSTISFWGSSDVSNTITGSVLFQSANGNFPFGNAVGTLTCV